jgi:hypothetical protein
MGDRRTIVERAGGAIGSALSWTPEGELQLDTVLASSFKVGDWGMWEFINQAIKTSRDPGALASMFSSVLTKSLRHVGLAATAGDVPYRAF